MAALLETHQLGKKYRQLNALQDVSLSLQSGEIIGLVGKNGAGKTTLLSLICGVITPSSGTISVLGQPPSANALLGKIGMLLQEANFKRGVPVSKQMTQFARLQGLSRQQAEAEIRQLLGRIPDTDYALQKPETMSYGQRKRLGILQAFLGKPELIILDEPTAGLDPIVADEIRQFITSYRQRSSIIISSHNIYEIEDICDRVVIVEAGRLIANSSMEELSQADAILNFSTDAPLPTTALDEISALADILNVHPDAQDKTKISCEYASAATDQLQLSIQQIILKHGRGVVSMSRGNSATAEILDRVNQGSAE